LIQELTHELLIVRATNLPTVIHWS